MRVTDTTFVIRLASRILELWEGYQEKVTNKPIVRVLSAEA